MSEMTFETDNYTDRAGKKWFCVADKVKKQMVCTAENGDYTCASFKTFTVWRWEPQQEMPWAVPSEHLLGEK